MPNKSNFNVQRIISRLSRIDGGFLFLLSLLLVVGYAAWLFYQFVYPPVFLLQTAISREAVFNKQLFQKVIERIESKERRITERLLGIPRNPFGDSSK